MKHSTVALLTLLAITTMPILAAPRVNVPQNPSALVGGGNFDNGEVNAAAETKLKFLAAIGGTRCRVNLYPGRYLTNNDWARPNPTCLDAIVAAAHARGITPMILFEYYADYELKGELKLGTTEQWRSLGAAFAERFRPNGTWGREHGVRDWGITEYSAVNEPDGGEFRAGGKIGPARYVAALRGLGQGVHSVDRSLLAMPGGFLGANAFSDWTLRGIGPALAPLWNNGTLDALDLHTYYDVQYAPMEKSYDHSAQHNFDAVKKVCGITRDILFCSTEFNYKKRLVTEEQAAKGFLTGIWDNLGVVGIDGKSGVTLFAFPWNLFNDSASDENYGLRVAFDPPQMTKRGDTLRMVLALTRGMRFERRDPRGAGEFVLSSAGRRLWVWQNRAGWTNHPGTAFTLTGIPRGATRVEVYGWDGLRRTLPTAGQSTLTVSGLPGDETTLFLTR